MGLSTCVACSKPTEHLCLVLGDQWLDFCEPCSTSVKLNNSETGEEVTPRELADRL